MLTFNVYKTNHGLFFKLPLQYNYTLCDYISFINGIDVNTLVLNNGWFRLPDHNYIYSCTKYKSGNSTLSHYELIDKSLQSDKIPLILSLDNVQRVYDDTDEEYKWSNFTSIRYLYKEVYTTPEKVLSDVDFTVNVLGNLEIDNFEQPEKCVIKSKNDNNYFNNAAYIEQDLKDIVVYSDIEKMLIPEFMLHTRPCELTSHQVYKIVRQYIIDNYNPKECEITSNYDFCFTVKKLIHTKPYPVKVDVSSGWSKKPKYVTQNRDTKKVTIFEMTYSGYKGTGGYEGYTCIDGWKANSLKEMKDNIKEYLDDLITTINTPLHECTNCNGHGVLFKQIETNKR